MAINRRHIGFSLPPFTVSVEPRRLKQFALAIGEPAHERQIVMAPPTFMKVIEGEQQSSQTLLVALGVDLRCVLHAEQQFDYLLPISAGDRLTVTRTVTDVYAKKGGTLEFIVIESVVTRAEGIIAGRSRQVVLVRNPPFQGAP